MAVASYFELQRDGDREFGLDLQERRECTDSDDCLINVFPGTVFYPTGSGPHVTNTLLRYLSCENCKWKFHMRIVGRTYSWDHGAWTDK